MKATNALLLILFFNFFTAKAQISNPVKWKAKIEKKSASEYVLTFSGSLEKGWHLYAQATPDGGPLPLELIFSNNNGNCVMVGKAAESATTTEFSKVFGVNETFFKGNFSITQIIKVTNAGNTSIRAELSYQICKDVCIPQNSYFEFDTKSLKTKELPRNKPKARNH